MDWYAKYKSPLGYQVGENQIDSYGVDHSGFSVRDELAYQRARQQRENRIMQNYNGQGISKDYPQYGTDFWGNSPENNYGFGVSNITPNVENMQNTPVPNIGPKPLSQEQMYTPPSPAAEVLAAGFQGFGNGIGAITQRESEIVSQAPNRLNSLIQTAYNLAANYNQTMNSPQEYKKQDPVSVKNSTLENVINYLKQYKIITDKKLSDVNKHQYMSCLAGKDGIALGLTGLALGVGKEFTDLTRKYFNEEQKKAYGGWSGIWSDSLKDMNNNIKGFAHGFVDNQPCYPLLKKPLP